MSASPVSIAIPQATLDDLLTNLTIYWVTPAPAAHGSSGHLRCIHLIRLIHPRATRAARGLHARHRSDRQVVR